MFCGRREGGRPSALWMGVVLSLFLSVFTAVAARGGNVNSSPVLIGGKVTPENGTWGSTFIFEVIYIDPENLMPAEGYPRIYINRWANGSAMVENDPTDDDVTDGKLYRYEWTPAGEDIGKHSFYFYAENPKGENAQDPMDGVYSGPRVTKKPTTIDNFEVDVRDPNPGKVVTFSGYLKCDNAGVDGKIEIRILFKEDVFTVGSDNAVENGYFSISIEAPDSGSFGYIAKFDGNSYYENSQSDMEYLTTFDAFTIATIYCILSVIMILVLMFLLSRRISRAQYLKPALIGFLAAVVFIRLFVASLIGLMVAGAIAGYLYARNVSGWSKHLRVGGLVALFFMLFLCFESAYFIRGVAASLVLGIGYSISNGEFLELLIINTIFVALFFIIFVGVGAIFGGLLRKLLKPAERGPVTELDHRRSE
ncbi:MAG: hypothetical protein QMC89_02470 [Candidatus Hodarchaeaceae archaeon]|nr:hypothetical protein [Candidatus Hodarchaeaceae archaeon]